MTAMLMSYHVYYIQLVCIIYSLAELDAEVRKLGRELKEIEKEILYQRNHKTGHPDDKFIQVMGDFVTVATYKFSELEDKFKEMQDRVSGTVQKIR